MGAIVSLSCHSFGQGVPSCHSVVTNLDKGRRRVTELSLIWTSGAVVSLSCHSFGQGGAVVSLSCHSFGQGAPSCHRVVTHLDKGRHRVTEVSLILTRGADVSLSCHSFGQGRTVLSLNCH